MHNVLPGCSIISHISMVGGTKDNGVICSLYLPKTVELVGHLHIDAESKLWKAKALWLCYYLNVANVA